MQVHRSPLCLALSLLLVGSASAADVIQFDLTSIFNADVVVNDGAAGLDSTQDPVDLGLIASGNFAFMTQSVSDSDAPSSPDGLPNDGLIIGSPAGFDVQLAVDNDDDGNNAFRIASMPGGFDLPVPAGNYVEVHVFATTGDGSSDVQVDLHYDDGSTDSSAAVAPDWFDDPADTEDLYRLIDGRDRMNPGNPPGTPFGYEESNDPAIFGLRVLADASKRLESLSVSKTDSTGALNVFGAAGVMDLACCSPCSLALLLEPLEGVARLPTSSPCLMMPLPPTNEDCCATVDVMLPLLGNPRLASTHPCFLEPTETTALPPPTPKSAERLGRSRASRLPVR